MDRHLYFKICTFETEFPEVPSIIYITVPKRIKFISQSQCNLIKSAGLTLTAGQTITPIVSFFEEQPLFEGWNSDQLNALTNKYAMQTDVQRFQRLPESRSNLLIFRPCVDVGLPREMIPGTPGKFTFKCRIIVTTPRGAKPMPDVSYSTRSQEVDS
jgi:hypothetical protein